MEQGKAQRTLIWSQKGPGGYGGAGRPSVGPGGEAPAIDSLVSRRFFPDLQWEGLAEWAAQRWGSACIPLLIFLLTSFLLPVEFEVSNLMLNCGPGVWGGEGRLTLSSWADKVDAKGEVKSWPIPGCVADRQTTNILLQIFCLLNRMV